jgi:hypothetical protein
MAIDAGVVESLPQRAPVTVTSASSPSSSSASPTKLSAPSAAFATAAAPDAAEKSEYEKKQREAELRRAREERRQKEEEQRRIKDHIKDMKLDRARKVHRRPFPASFVCCAVLTPRTWQYNRGGATTGTAPGPTTTSAPAPVPTAPASSASAVALLQVYVPSCFASEEREREHALCSVRRALVGQSSYSRLARASRCVQIRLPTGATVKHEFASTDTLGTGLRLMGFIHDTA